LEIDRKTTPQGLGDVARLPRFQIHFDAGRHHHRAHLAVHDKRLVFVRTHLISYSVDTGTWLPPLGIPSLTARSRSRAAFNVCQHRLAHLTREGNSRTPERAASLPSSGPGTTSC